MAHDLDDPAQPDESANEQLPTLELETLLGRPPSRRKRLAQLGLLLAVGVVLLTAFWGDIAPSRQAPSAPAPQLTKAPATLLITSDVNYGTITVNGKKAGSLPLVVEMQGDTYDITLDTPRFARSPATSSLPTPAQAIAWSSQPTISFSASMARWFHQLSRSPSR